MKKKKSRKKRRMDGVSGQSGPNVQARVVLVTKPEVEPARAPDVGIVKETRSRHRIAAPGVVEVLSTIRVNSVLHDFRKFYKKLYSKRVEQMRKVSSLAKVLFSL